MRHLKLLIAHGHISKYERAILAFFLLVAAGFALLRLIDLRADMPSDITWSQTFYTDEGIYARNAAMLVSTGNWYVETDYNTAINYPIYFVLQVIFFKLFGVNLEAARLLSVVSTLATIGTIWWMVYRFVGSRAAAITVLLISTNFFFFVHSRYGQADMPMTLFIVLSLACLLLKRAKWEIWLTAVSGLLMVFAILTKTTAIFAVPILLFLIWQQYTTRRSRVTHSAILVGIIGFGLALHRLLLVKPYFLDYRRVSAILLSRINNTFNEIAYSFWTAIKGGVCIGSVLYISALIVGVLLFISFSSIRQNIIFRIALLWHVFSWLILSVSSYQPSRYFSHLVIPVAIILGIGIDHLLQTERIRILGYVMLGLVLFSSLEGVFKITQYLSSAEHSLYQTANDVRRQIESEGTESPLLVGHIAGNISLANDLLSVGAHFAQENEDFRLEKHRPTHFVELGPVSKKAEQLFAEAGYTLEFLKKYDVLNNYSRGKQVYFYRLIK